MTVGSILAALRAGITGGWTTIIATVARLALVIAEAVRDRQLLNAGRAIERDRLSTEERDRLDSVNRARIDAAGGVFVDPFDAANRPDMPGSEADLIRQPGDSGGTHRSAS